ncbi:MAG: ATP-binding protein [Sandarakinorhabdus sp.]|jgi:two-component system phosphate regulon sensor histidine kinase PhoR|nr:ATP-binding protein [Sandarakinorhabdus sp.]
MNPADTSTIGIEMALLALGAMLLGFVLGRLGRPDPVVLPAPVPPAPPPAPAGPPPNRIAIESLRDAALVVRGPLVESANAPARSLFGQRVVGSDLRLTVRHPVLLDALDAVLAGGPAQQREVGGLGGDNRAFRLRIVPDGEGRSLVLLDDVTDAKATERMRVDFVANASHELRTPLATLTGFIETLQGPAAEDEPARQRFLAIMAQEADRMRRLIDDLMSLSRIELDKFVRPTQSLDLKGIVAEVGRTLAMRLEADQRRLLIEEPDTLPRVIADRDQVLQVLHNLISNALKYGRTGTPIRVILGMTDDAVRLTVADEGEGIAPEHLPRLTERFYRVDSQRSRTLGGTGLGLAIVKHIVERHRGRLEIESKPGEGTRVSFTVPLA